MKKILSTVTKVVFKEGDHSIIKNQKENEKGLNVLYLDLKKAYDSVEHWALENTLKNMGFEYEFCKLIREIYQNSKLKIITPFEDTDEFNVYWGVRQGCPLSPTL